MSSKRIALLLLSGSLLAGVFSTSAAEAIYRLAMPGQRWSVELDLTGYEIQGERTRENGLGKMVQAKDEKRGILVSVFLEKEPDLRSADECRAYYWAKDQASPLPKDDIRLTERGELRLVEWTVREFMGQRVNQRNLKAFLAHAGYCVDVHISKSDFKMKHQEIFDDLIAKIRIAEE